MTVQDTDPGLAAFRDEITALDLQLLETINERLETVRALQSYKQEHGLAFLDPDREAWLVEHLQQANGGPLSAAGVAELCEFVLDLVKRELAGDTRNG
jgi:chorismate mutase